MLNLYQLYKYYGGKYTKPRPTPHCRVLPPGEFNDMIIYLFIKF